MSGQRRRIGVVPSEELADISLSTQEITQSSRAISVQLQLLESSKATERARGVQELADILREDAHGKGLLAASFSSGVWEHIITWTARILIKESQSFVNKYGEEWPAVSSAGEKLCHRIQTQYSGHVRHIWIAAMPYLSAKPSRFLAKHITNSLVEDPCLVYVFGLEYAKVLRAWAMHEPHVRDCSDNRADIIIALCIQSLSKFGNASESQDSTDSSTSQTISPGDVEYAQVLFAIVSSAAPARLYSIGQKILDFCIEYCRFHVRENGCLATILDTVNVIILFQPEKQLVGDSDRLKALLSSCLRLWQTRTVSLKHAVLSSIRIITRLLAHIYATTREPETLDLLKLALKTVTSSAWDRFKFMSLPRELLSIWNLVDEIDPYQLGFFDTAAFLVAFLTALSSRVNPEAADHRKKRIRSAPTSISRLLTSIGSDDSIADARGSAQLLWFTVNIYADKLGYSCCAELFYDIKSIIQNNDMSQRSELAEWVLGIYRSLASREHGELVDRIPVSPASDDVWQHAIAGLEAGLFGTAGLLFDMLHRCDGSSALAHSRCRQASDALASCSHKHGGDYVQLLILISQYTYRGGNETADPSIAHLCSRVIVQFCQTAAKQKWTASLFACVAGRALGIPLLSTSHAKDGYSSLPDSTWHFELRFANVLHVLAAFSETATDCRQLLMHHSPTYLHRNSTSQLLVPSACAKQVSNLPLAQWRMVFDGLLESLDTSIENEYNAIPNVTIPYIACILSGICAHSKELPHLLSIESLNNISVVCADAGSEIVRQMETRFSERLVTFISEPETLELSWQTLSFIYHWDEGYCRIAYLEATMNSLLDALFDHSNSNLLCALSIGDFAGSVVDIVHTKSAGVEPSAYQPTERNNHYPIKRHQSGSANYNGLLTTQMLSRALRLVHAPWAPLVSVLSMMINREPGLSNALANRLGNLISCLTANEFLVSCEFVMQCIMLCEKAFRNSLVGALKERLLSFLDSYNYAGYHPALFSVLLTIHGIICAPESTNLTPDEDLPRFVAWVCEEAKGDLLDISVEVYLLRSLIGPWDRKEDASLMQALSVLDFSATDVLVSRAQRSLSFGVRVTAEEQLAVLGLGLPYLLPNAIIAYPDVPECEADDMLVLMTRNIGVSLLITSSGSMIPGSLCILIKQLHPDSGCTSAVTSLCRRLLWSISSLSGFASVDQMVTFNGPDIFSIEPDIFETINRVLTIHRDPELEYMLRSDLAIELMLRGELDKAVATLPKTTDATGNSWTRKLFVHSVVLAIVDPELHSHVHKKILVPYITVERIKQFLEETPETTILLLLQLYKPEADIFSTMDAVLDAMEATNGQMHISRAYKQIYGKELQQRCNQKPLLTASPMPQWGRYYSMGLICNAIEVIAQTKTASKATDFLSGPRASWIAVHLHTQIQLTLWDDKRRRLVYSLCLLAKVLHPNVLDSPLFQAVFFRALVDCWLCVPGSTDAACCLALTIMLDNSLSISPCKMLTKIGPRFIGSIISTRQLSRIAPDAIEKAVFALTCTLRSIAKMEKANVPVDADKLFIDGDTEKIYDWNSLSSLVITKSAVKKIEDRLALVGIGESAAYMLDTEYYSLACAEVLVESIERLVHLALPLNTGASQSALANMVDGEPVQLDLSASIVQALGRIQETIFSYLRRPNNASTMNKRVIFMLLRALSLLLVSEQPESGIATHPKSKNIISKEGDVYWHICNIVTTSRHQNAVLAAISVSADLAETSEGSESKHTHGTTLKWADANQKWILREVHMMPEIALDRSQFPSWVQSASPPALDLALLELLCSSNRTADTALSELVCALAVRKECVRLKPAIPLILADSQAASCLLPHIIHEILLTASPEERADISAFLLDFTHNWQERAPQVARDIIFRTLETRELAPQYADIREFFSQLPLALFEFAYMAAKLDMPKIAAFLLECDLTCTGTEKHAAVADMSAEAKYLLGSVYRSLGNQPAAQLLGSINSVNDIMRRCQDTANWRTLLLYQEAAPRELNALAQQNIIQQQQSSIFVDNAEFEIGDTLVNLGLLNSIRPELMWADKEAGLSTSQYTGSTQAAFAASWRLAKWDIPTIPLVKYTSISDLPTSSVFLVPVNRTEESLYSIFKLRSCAQLSEAHLAVQEYMSTSNAVAALTVPSGNLRDSWAYHAISTLLPLVTGTNSSSSFNANGFVQESQIAEFLLARSSGIMNAKTLAPVYTANLVLHEIAICDARALGFLNTITLPPLFRRYKEAVHLACVASRQAGNWQNSMNYIFRLRSLIHTIRHSDQLVAPEFKLCELEFKLWEAETLWDAGNYNMAIEILQSHKKEMEHTLQQAKRAKLATGNGNFAPETYIGSSPLWTSTELETGTILLSRIILTIGEWSDKQRKERPDVLWEGYFNKSAQLLQGVNSPTSWTGKALHALADFSGRQCEELTARKDDESTNAMRKQKSRELAACQQQLSRATNSADASRLKAILRRLEIQVTNDQKELAELRASIGGFLRLSIWSFVKCLECCSMFDSSVYSLISLIMTHARSSELHTVLSSGLMDGVPSHKFLPLVHQLCARLSTESDAFHTTLAQLVHRMAVDYPYHTLYHLFALRNANRTSPSSDPSKNLRRSSSFIAQPPVESEKLEQRRSEAATAIIVGITTNSQDLKSIVQAIDELCNTYIELAIAPVPEKYKSSKLEGKLIEFGSKLRIRRLVKNMSSNIPVLTASPKAEAPRDYMCVPFISTIADGYSLAGGINLPKITRVLGTDGKRYKQLVKGKDDMRQDAIIEQLFHVINRFMNSARSKAPGSAPSVNSGLQVRTYQVVPLTKRCGVLQWVDNTIPLGNWFRDKETKYRSDAPTTTQLRSIVHNVHKDKMVTAQQKLQVFDHVCALAPPIFRFFFYEHFYNPQSWFEHREVYIRSAAVSSIAGWVLGIGDRHLQNILVDQSTAELVHIDLGIAFDLGKLLPIPEAVPFRLTREMVDGMGLLGLEGTFRHISEVALEAMRKNARVVITILNVLKVDPLYMWSLIPLRMDKMNRTADVYTDDLRDGSRIGSTHSDVDGEQDILLDEETDMAAAEEENKEAWRSILHVGQRLKATISVEGQVSELIQQATDRTLLSRMFEGWSAWY
ncbi:hypothetical protein EDC05_000518 [Coemansia umbellata]|uniref:Serine/threonine-protein kinase Tel1 n=1 Tax=Coemansia umbellata TaxID=1424467 RepID=A0ABQ8PUE1_9FUNG|nr:hypothetical protein EDC05_000518 [Coemansia umbellata]